MPAKPPPYLSTTQVAKLLGISSVAVFKRIKSGRIKAQKIGRSYAVQPQHLAEFLPKKAVARGVGEEHLSLMEVSRMLGVTRMTVYNWIRKGILPSARVGRHYVIAKKDLPKNRLSLLSSPDLSCNYLSVMEYAAVTGSNRKTVLNHINQGRIPARKVGRHYVIARHDLPQAGLFVSPVVKASQEFLSLAEAARVLGISRISVYKKVKKGQIAAERMGRSFAIPRAALEDKDNA